MTEQLIAELVTLGLTKLESKTYFILLKKKTYTASEIAKLAGVNRSNMYGMLRGLIQKGFCMEIDGSVQKFSAVEPNIAFENLKNNYLSKIRTIDKISGHLQKMYEESKDDTSAVEFVSLIKTKAGLTKKLGEIEKSAKSIIRSFIKPPILLDLEQYREEMKKDNNRLSYKTIFEPFPEDDYDYFVKLATLFSDLGEEVRISPTLPFKLLVFDDNITITSLSSFGDDNTTMIIEHPAHAIAMTELFDKYWNTSISLEEYLNSHSTE